jgi:hypothetical protein
MERRTLRPSYTSGGLRVDTTDVKSAAPFTMILREDALATYSVPTGRVARGYNGRKVRRHLHEFVS